MKRLQVFRIVLYFVLALFLLHSNQTPNPPRLKIEPGMHEGKIWKIAKDTEERFLASASEDRTVKIWKVGSKGRLSFEKTIYPNFEKKTDFIFSVAMSPDGNQIALGHYNGDLSIYDRISGNLIQKIKDQDLSPNQ